MLVWLRKLVENMSDLGQVLRKGSAPHEDVVHVDEVAASGRITHGFVEEDVEFCWRV